MFLFQLIYCEQYSMSIHRDLGNYFKYYWIYSKVFSQALLNRFVWAFPIFFSIENNEWTCFYVIIAQLPKDFLKVNFEEIGLLKSVHFSKPIIYIFKMSSWKALPIYTLTISEMIYLHVLSASLKFTYFFISLSKYLL